MDLGKLQGQTERSANERKNYPLPSYLKLLKEEAKISMLSLLSEILQSGLD